MSYQFGQPIKYKAKLVLELTDENGNTRIFDQTSLLQDGRFGSHVCEDITPTLFSGLTSPTNSCEKGFDFNSPDGRVEMKSLTKNGASYTPSSMKGTGRYYDEVEYINTLNSNSVYAQNDVKEYGEINFLFMDSTFLKHGGKDGGPLKGYGKKATTESIALDYNKFMESYKSE